MLGSFGRWWLTVVGHFPFWSRRSRNGGNASRTGFSPFLSLPAQLRVGMEIHRSGQVFPSSFPAFPRFPPFLSKRQAPRSTVRTSIYDRYFSGSSGWLCTSSRRAESRFHFWAKSGQKSKISGIQKSIHIKIPRAGRGFFWRTPKDSNL